MPEVSHAFDEVTATGQNASDAYIDVPGSSIASGNFTAGNKYLIVVTVNLSMANASEQGYFKVVHGSTDFASSEHIGQNINGEWYDYFWFTVWTAVASEGIKTQFHGCSLCDDQSADTTTIFAMDLNDLTEDTDWFFDENTTDTSLTTSWSTTNNATETFTPEGASDWLVMSTSRMDPASSTSSLESRIDRGGEATTTDPSMLFEPVDAADFLVYGLFRVFALTAVSNTFTAKSRNDSASSGTRKSSAIFCINLDKFAVHADAYTEAELALAQTPEYDTEVQTASITPTETGDVWCLGQWIKDGGGIDVDGRLQVSNVDQPTGSSKAACGWPTSDATNECPVTRQTVENLGASATTVDLDASKNGAATVNAENRSLMLVTMLLAPPPAGASQKLRSARNQSVHRHADVSGKIRTVASRPESKN